MVTLDKKEGLLGSNVNETKSDARVAAGKGRIAGCFDKMFLD